MKTSRIIAIAALVAILILAMGLVAACGPTPTPTAAPTAAPTKARRADQGPGRSDGSAHRCRPRLPTAAPKPTEAPKPPVASISIVAVPGYASDPYAITATVTYVTETGKTARSTVALYTAGLSNVPISVPVQLHGRQWPTRRTAARRPSP